MDSLFWILAKAIRRCGIIIWFGNSPFGQGPFPFTWYLSVCVTSFPHKHTNLDSDGICVCQSLSHIWLFVTPWSVAHKAPLAMGFSRQEYWSGLPCPPPGDLPNPGIEPWLPALQANSLPSESPYCLLIWSLCCLDGCITRECNVLCTNPPCPTDLELPTQHHCSLLTPDQWQLSTWILIQALPRLLFF